MRFARFDWCIEVRLPDILDIPAWTIYQRRPPVKVVIVAACCWLINKLPCVLASVSLGTNKAVSIGSPTQVIPGPPYPGSAGTAGVPEPSTAKLDSLAWSLEHETTRTVTGRHSGEPNRPSDLKPGCV